jgi:hypothetical protein
VRRAGSSRDGHLEAENAQHLILVKARMRIVQDTVAEAPLSGF